MSEINVLVTGASGAVGPSIVSALRAEEFSVTVLCRNQPAPDLFPPDVQVLEGDVTDQESVALAIRGQDLVVHLASLLHVNKPSAQQEAAIERTNVEGTQNIISAAEQSGVERVIFISTIAVYGYDRGELDERSEPRPDTIYGRTKLVAEKIALGGINGKGEALSTVLRLSAVYGPRVKGNYRTLLDALARGRFLPVGAGLNRRTLVHCDDVARAVLVSLKSEQAAGQIYNVTDGENHELRTVIAVMCSALDREYPGISIPPKLVQVGALALDSVARLFGRDSNVSSTVAKYFEEVIVRGEKIASIGFSPRYDLEAGWKQTVADLRALGEL